MSPVSIVAVVGLLLAVVTAGAAVLLWRGARRIPGPEAAVYVIEDSVDFIAGRIDPSWGLSRPDVKRIVEWEVYYLQGLAQPQRWKPVETVAGGYEPAVDYIGQRIAERHGASYSRDQIKAVLALEAGYLLSIGVVGEPVDPEAGEFSEVDES